MIIQEKYIEETGVSSTNLPALFKWYIVTVTWLELLTDIDDPAPQFEGNARVIFVKATNKHVAKMFGAKLTLESFKFHNGIPHSENGRIALYQDVSAIEPIPSLVAVLDFCEPTNEKGEKNFFYAGALNTKDDGHEDVSNHDNVFELKPKKPKK